MERPAIGFIGLGRMGQGMAANLLSSGTGLTVFDIDKAATRALSAAGATVASSPAEVASTANVVFLSLPYTPQVENAVFGEGGVLEGVHEELLIVDTSTLNYYSALDIDKRVSAAGAAYCDCPVSGMPFRATDGSLTMMFGGSDETFGVVKPYLDIMGEYIIHCGEVGTGQVMKAINNVIYDINIAAISELMPLAVKVGLDPEQVADVVTSGSSRSFASEYFVPRILEGRFDADFAMEDAYKDIVNVQEMASRLKAPIPVASAMVATYQTAIAMGFGQEPKSAMIKVYEELLGQKVRKSGMKMAESCQMGIVSFVGCER